MAGNVANGITQADLNISIHALSRETKQILSKLLNPIKVIPTEEKLPRYWQGLAELVNLGSEDISCLLTDPDPTLKILNIWCRKDESTLEYLILYLQRLDRYDVIDDISILLINDITRYKTTKTVVSPAESTKQFSILGNSSSDYDAFIMYAHEDVEFATTLIDKLENEYRLKIFVKERDLAVGAVEHNATIKMIASWCNRLIVILSPAFVESAENKFFISFAQSIGIDQRRRKIIPCLYMPCDIPPELKALHMLDYGRSSGALYNFWEKLSKSIKTPVAPEYQLSSELFQQAVIPPQPSVQFNTASINLPKSKKFSIKKFLKLNHKRSVSQKL